MKVLYIEDNPLDVDLVRITLRKFNDEFDITFARTVAEAFSLLYAETPCPFDIVLSDMHLTDGSGLSILSEIRKTKIPVAVVMLTGQGDEDTALASLRSGATDYIVKRQNYLKELPDTLRKALQHYKEAEVAIPKSIHVLFGEHNATDIDQTTRYFKTHAPQFELDVISSGDEIISLLSDSGLHKKYDALLIDYQLPKNGAVEVIHSLRDRDLNLPTVVTTSQGSEESAVEIFKLGLTDYVVKSNEYLVRLPVVLENAYNLMMLQKEQKALRESEERFRLLAENAQDVIFRMSIEPSFKVEYLSPAAEKVTGYTTDEIRQNPRIILDQANKVVTKEIFEEWLMTPEIPSVNLPFEKKDGRRIWVELKCTIVRDQNGKPQFIEGIGRDITERIHQDTRLREQMERLNALHQIDKAITSSFDLRVTYQVLLDQMRQVLKVNACSIVQFEPELLQFQLIIASGFRVPEISLRSALLHTPLPADVISSKNTVQVNLEREKIHSQALLEIINQEKFIKYIATPMVIKGQIRGILEVYNRTEFEPGREWLSFFESLAQQAAIALDNSQNFTELQKSQSVLLQAYDDTLMGWANFLDLRDKETEGHTKRVLERTMKAAQRLGIRDSEMAHLRRGVLLHDIGKVGIPDMILNKPGPLNEEEWIIMKKHPGFAYEMLNQIAFLKPALDVPYCHHEKWDGSGYPRGLKGKDIPLTARIFAVFDVYDAITSNRSYNVAKSKDQAIQYIRENAGTHFDPDIIDTCIEVLNEK